MKNQNGGEKTTCLQDFQIVQYDDLKKPVISNENTYYRIFIIELFLIPTYNQQSTPDQARTKNTIEVLYAIQECINDFLEGNNSLECIKPFIDHVNNWKKYKIQNTQDKILLVNKDGELQEEDIKNNMFSSFKGFLERYSKSLSYYINKYVNVNIVNGYVKNESVDSFIGKYPPIAYIIPRNYIHLFLQKFKADVQKPAGSLKPFFKQIAKS